LADHLYSIKRRIFFLLIAKAFWNHQHRWWFSLYKKSSRNREQMIIL